MPGGEVPPGRVSQGFDTGYQILMDNIVIDEQSQVTLHFSLALESGDVVDSTFDRSPATFTMGDGSLLEGFERCLLGLGVGAAEEFIIEPEQGFGQWNPNNVQRFSRAGFDPELELSPGLVMNFADAANGELPGVIRAVDGQQVEVDFNHPLAGHRIVFRIEIVAVAEVAR